MHRHLENEGRLEDDEHRAEVTEAGDHRDARTRSCSTRWPSSSKIKVSQNELLDYLVNASRQYGMDPNQFIQTVDQRRPDPGDGRRGRALQGARGGPAPVEVKDADGNVVDLTEFIGTDEEDAAAEAAAAAAGEEVTDAAGDVTDAATAIPEETAEVGSDEVAEDSAADKA